MNISSWVNLRSVISVGCVIQTKEDDINHLKQESQRLNKLREGIQRKLREAESYKVEIEQQKDTLKNQTTAMERGQSDSNTWHLAYNAHQYVMFSF